MKLILVEDVHGLGQIGNTVVVKNGFARNFLLPRSLALPANEENTKQLAHQIKVLERKRNKVLAAVKALAKKIERSSLEIVKKVGDEEKIFGSVTTAEIEAAFKEKGLDVPKRKITILSDIKKVGVYEAEVKLHQEVTAQFKFWIVAQ